MNIPDEAIEAAAQFMQGAFDGREHYGTDWKYLAEEMLPLLAPPIAAQALREAADATPEAMFVQFAGDPIDLNEDRRRFLRERADQIGPLIGT